MPQKFTKEEALKLLEENIDNYWVLSLDRYPWSKDTDFIVPAYILLLEAGASSWMPSNQKELFKKGMPLHDYWRATQISYKLMHDAKLRRRNKLKPMPSVFNYFKDNMSRDHEELHTHASF